jgi:hypothetical protein
VRKRGPEKTLTCRCGGKSRPFLESTSSIEEESGFRCVNVEGVERWLCASCYDACVLAASIILDVFGAEDERDVMAGRFVREAEESNIGGSGDGSWRDTACSNCPICGSDASPDSTDW